MDAVSHSYLMPARKLYYVMLCYSALYAALLCYAQWVSKLPTPPVTTLTINCILATNA